jgi:gamma-glutamylcyclotransferase (GGCT)/AIG2-like uncharacterized protein YtfP
MTDLLFVYGTLRRGCWNDIARIAPTASYAGKAQLRGRLFDLGTYPALLLDGQADLADGELYRVPADAWGPLDDLEQPVSKERPDGEYFKLVVGVTLPDGSVSEAWTYAANAQALKLDAPIAESDWIAYARRVGKRP